MKQTLTQKIALVLGPLAFLLILTFFKPDGLSKQGIAVLATTLWIAIWWIFEVIPIAVTALLPIILFPLTGAMSLNSTTTSFGHKYVFLYIGGFILAIAIEKWNLHKRIALNIIKTIGTNVKQIILGFMLATAFLSMWISNTATTVMMLPIAMAIVTQLKDNPNTIENENSIFGKALMLAIAYSASIGGIATLIGTPPNLIFAGVLEDQYGIEISFAKWIMYGLPLAIILLFICWKYLTKIAFKFEQNEFPGGKSEIEKQITLLGKFSYEEKIVGFVFLITAILWIIRSFVLKQFLPNIDDTIIAIIGAISLFLIPTKTKKGEKIMDWKSASKLPWDILLLFGGGLAIANGFKTSGLAAWIGTQLTLINHLPLFLLLLVLVFAVNFLTEITSNLATTAMLLPVIIPVAVSLNIHPFTLMVGITTAASCAFMLPVATPPNAIVFGSGYLKIKDMMRTGVLLNMVSVIIITLMVYFLLPMLWDYNPYNYPKTYSC